MPETDDKQIETTPLGEPVQSKDFLSLYANNVFFETTAFDLKMTVGEVMRTSKAPYIEQRASVTMSWLEAKLAGIFFLVNIMIHEQSYGTIPIPRPVLPPFIGEEQAGAPIDTIIASITAQVAADVANAVREAREASKKQTPK